MLEWHFQLLTLWPEYGVCARDVRIRSLESQLCRLFAYLNKCQVPFVWATIAMVAATVRVVLPEQGFDTWRRLRRTYVIQKSQHKHWNEIQRRRLVYSCPVDRTCKPGMSLLGWNSRTCVNL